MEEFKKVFIRDTDLVTTTTLQGKITSVNDNFCEASKYSCNELIDRSFKLIRNPETPKKIYKDLWNTIKAGKVWKGVLKNKDKNGRAFILSMTIFPLENEYLAISNEITEFVDAINDFDTRSKNKLSGIANRDTMMQDIENRTTKFFQIAIINIDNFKHINNYFSYKVGDDLIKKISEFVIKEADKHKGYHAYHLSVDEFAIVYNTDKEHKEYILENICDALHRKVETKELKVDTHNLNISISTGLSMGDDAYETIKQADMALIYAKENNLNVVNFKNTDKLVSELNKTLEWSAEIKDALTNQRIIPWIQPIYDNKSGEIIKFEALMRLIKRDGKVVTPWFFLDISVKTKVYHKLSYMMIEKTLQHFSTNLDYFNINVVWEDIMSEEITEMIFHYLEKYEDLGPRLTVEIVESESIESFDMFSNFIDEIKTFGSKVVIDDFGTGYSNFIYLEKMNIDGIKIDGSLIKGMMENENTLFIVKSIVAIAKKLGVKTVAEFVENEEVFEKVKSLGIDYSQGYYFGKPRSIDW